MGKLTTQTKLMGLAFILFSIFSMRVISGFLKNSQENTPATSEFHQPSMETNHKVSPAAPETRQETLEQIESLDKGPDISEGQGMIEADNQVPGQEAVLIPTSTSTPVVCALPERVLFITFDGLRANVISENHLMENLEALAIDGAYDWNAQTIEPSATLPGHASLFSGLEVIRHGIDVVNVSGLKTKTFSSPSIFQMIKAFENNPITVMVIAKKNLLFFHQSEAIDIFRRFDDANQVISFATRFIQREDFDLMFLHLPDIDQAGHKAEETGNFNSQEYLDTADQLDQSIQHLFNAMKEKEIFHSTLIIVTADHGGDGGGHSDSTPLDRTIPWIIHGPCVKNGFDISTTGRVVDIFDTAPTILWALGIPFEPEIFDGKPVMEAYMGLPQR